MVTPWSASRSWYITLKLIGPSPMLSSPVCVMVIVVLLSRDVRTLSCLDKHRLSPGARPLGRSDPRPDVTLVASHSVAHTRAGLLTDDRARASDERCKVRVFRALLDLSISVAPVTSLRFAGSKSGRKYGAVKEAMPPAATMASTLACRVGTTPSAATGSTALSMPTAFV